MEFKIIKPETGDFVKAIEWNHEEIKAEITEKVAFYNSLVYTDDQIKEAKADRAELNKFVKALEDKRKEIKAQCLAPYDSFEKQLKEIVAIVQEPIKVIDAQVKAYEAKQKEDKLNSIKEYFETKEFHGIAFEKVFEEKWLNATTSFKAITESIDKTAQMIEVDLKVIEDFGEYKFEALTVYKNTLDLRSAIAETKRLSQLAAEKAKYEAEKALEEEKVEEVTSEPEPEAAEVEEALNEEDYDFTPEVGFIPEFVNNFVPDFSQIKDRRSWSIIKVFTTPEQLADIRTHLNTLGIPSEVLNG